MNTECKLLNRSRLLQTQEAEMTKLYNIHLQIPFLLLSKIDGILFLSNSIKSATPYC